MLRWLLGLLVAAILTAFTALLLHGRYVDMGPVILRLSYSHGIHRGDLFVAAGWLVGLVALLALVVGRRRQDGS